MNGLQKSKPGIWGQTLGQQRRGPGSTGFLPKDSEQASYLRKVGVVGAGLMATQLALLFENCAQRVIRFGVVWTDPCCGAQFLDGPGKFSLLPKRDAQRVVRVGLSGIELRRRGDERPTHLCRVVSHACSIPRAINCGITAR